MIFHVIMACHNRRALTVEAVEGALASGTQAGVDVRFTIFDDGSTDGTTEDLTGRNLPLVVLRGDGSAYWARSMALAESDVLSNVAGAASDMYLVWLNDDVRLDQDAFSRLRTVVEEHAGSVVVGAVRDPRSARVTYSGMRKRGLHPLRFELVDPAGAPKSVDTFNGNCIVVPLTVARQLGGIDGEFSHGLADIDYGLRCRNEGVPVLLAPGTVGTCPRNTPNLDMTPRARWHEFTGQKGGGNFSSLNRFLERHFRGPRAVVICASYALWWIRLVVRFRTNGMFRSNAGSVRIG